MDTIIVMDYASGSILFIRLSEDEVKQIEEKYDGDVEEWMVGTDVEKKFHFRLKDSYWMSVEDVPEIFYCYPKRNETVQMFPMM